MYIYLRIVNYLSKYNCVVFLNKAGIKESSIQTEPQPRSLSYTPFEASEGNEKLVKNQKESFSNQTKHPSSVSSFQLRASECVSTRLKPNERGRRIPEERQRHTKTKTKNINKSQHVSPRGQRPWRSSPTRSTWRTPRDGA